MIFKSTQFLDNQPKISDSNYFLDSLTKKIRIRRVDPNVHVARGN